MKTYVEAPSGIRFYSCEGKDCKTKDSFKHIVEACEERHKCAHPRPRHMIMNRIEPTSGGNVVIIDAAKYCDKCETLIEGVVYPVAFQALAEKMFNFIKESKEEIKCIMEKCSRPDESEMSLNDRGNVVEVLCEESQRQSVRAFRL